jgi:hypothetical protein
VFPVLNPWQRQIICVQSIALMIGLNDEMAQLEKQGNRGSRTVRAGIASLAALCGKYVIYSPHFMRQIGLLVR